MSTKITVHTDDQLNKTFTRIFLSGQSRKLYNSVSKIDKKYIHKEVSLPLLQQYVYEYPFLCVCGAEVTVLRSPEAPGPIPLLRFMIFSGNPETIRKVVTESFVNKDKLVDSYLISLGVHASKEPRSGWGRSFKYIDTGRTIEIMKQVIEMRETGDSEVSQGPMFTDYDGQVLSKSLEILTDDELKLLFEKRVVYGVHQE